MKSVGLLLAMWEELNPLRRHWKLDWTGPGNFFSGRVGDLRLQVALSGVGPRRARQACANLLRFGKPDMLLSAGYSGGLRPELRPGDCLLARKIYTPDGPIESSLPEPPTDPKWQAAALLCVDQLAPQAVHKQTLSERYPDTAAVDMESAVLAETANQAGLPWLALRVVIDDLHTDLPLDFSRCLNEHGQMHPGKLAQQVLLNPQRLPGLIRFSKGAERARRRLVECTDSLLAEVVSRC